MHTKWVFKHFRPRAGEQNFFLILLWGIGLVLGVMMCVLAPYDISDIFFGAINTKSSIFSLSLICILPVVFAALSVRMPFRVLSYLPVFLIAVSRGFCGTAIYIAVGHAAWLLRSLLLFSATCTSVLMWWILLQANTGSHINKQVRLSLCLSCLIYIIELFLISPLVGDLVKVL